MKAFPVVDRMLSFKPASFSWAPVSVTDAPRCCGSIKSIQPNSPSLPQRGTHNWAQIAIDMLKIRKSCRFNPSPNCIYIYIYTAVVWDLSCRLSTHILVFLTCQNSRYQPCRNEAVAMMKIIGLVGVILSLCFHGEYEPCYCSRRDNCNWKL